MKAENRPIQLSPIALQILLALVKEDRHGYGIKLEVEQRTGGALNLGSGTLYQALDRLQKTRLVSPVEADANGSDSRRGRTYHLQEAGRKALVAELERLDEVIRYAREVDLLGGTSPSR